jgi:MFS family permease
MKKRNFRLLYAHEIVFQISDILLVIVMPIFLYRLFGTLVAPFMFVFVWNLIYGILFIPVFNLAMKWKRPKEFMATGIAFYSISLALFAMVTPDKKWILIPGMLFFGLYVAFYWMLRYWFISVNIEHSIVGRQISSLDSIRIIVNFVSPLMAGLVSYWVSFNATLFIGAVMGIFSIIPIFMFHMEPYPRQYDFAKVKRILQKPVLKSLRVVYFCESFSHNFVFRSWILAFAIFIGSVMELGILFAFTTIVAAGLTHMAGHWFDGRRRLKLLKRLTRGITLGGFLYSSVILLPSMIYITIVNIYCNLVINMHQTVVKSYLFAFSSKIHPIHFHLNREIWIIIGRLLCTSILMIIFTFLPEGYLWIIIAIGAVLFSAWHQLRKADHLLH